MLRGRSDEGFGGRDSAHGAAAGAEAGAAQVAFHGLGEGFEFLDLVGYDRRFVPRLRTLARDFDAVIVHGLWQYSTLGAWRALRGTGTPYFVFPHGMLDPWFRRAYPLKHLKKWLYWTLAERRVLRDARAVLFTAEEERRLARQTFWLYRCREETVGLGIPAPLLDRPRQTEAFLRQYPALRGRRLWLFLGRLHSKKGCDLLLRAFGKLRGCGRAADVTLVLAGPPDSPAYLQHLQALAAETCPDDSVLFPGMLSGDLKWGAFQAAEAFVLPSHQENFGLAVAESLAAGTPVLISCSINIWREIEQDGAGLVAPADQAGTEQLLHEWEDTPPARRAAMATAAAQTFATRFEITAAARNLSTLLQSHAAPRDSPS